MSVFNSLGSNYDLGFALKALFSSGQTDLRQFLEKKFGGEAVLLYKGREAITLALKSSNLPKDSQVAINGLTCYVVYRGIEEAGFKPVLIDIPKDDLNFSAEALESKLKSNPKIKAVIIQNTLGYPCDIEAISKICKENNLILIEDLAHSAGAKYFNVREAGNIGDVIILSFSQDKIIDAVSGGAIIVKNSKFRVQNYETKNSDLVRQLKDRFYPILTWKIRIVYDFGVGKILHAVSKILNLLSAPMDNSLYGFIEMPKINQALAILAFRNLEENLNHRRKIASIYAQNLTNKIIFPKINSQIQNSTNLRFPIFVEDRENLIKFLKSKGFYLSDIWYDAPVAPRKYMKKINYKNDCPIAEKISEKILNLPTHKNISENQAHKLTNLINYFLNLKS